MSPRPLRARFAIPGDPETPTGGYVYDRRLTEAAPAAGLELIPLRLPDGFPDPSPEALARTLAMLAEAAAADPAPILIDGLALGVLPAEAVAALPVPVVAMHHHPLGMETGLAPERAAALIASEKAALSACAAVIATSTETARTIARVFDIPLAAVTVAEPGLERPAAPALRRGAPPVILGVGTISARKGWDVLAEALAGIAHLPWRAEIVGARDRDPAADAALSAQLAALGLTDRVTLRGALPAAALAEAYQGADLFVLPSRYEGYGMAPVEAMAHGLPVICSDAGALAEATGGAAVLVPPEDAGALALAIAATLTDRAQADALAAASLARAATAPNWTDAAGLVAGAIAAAMRRVAA